MLRVTVLILSLVILLPAVAAAVTCPPSRQDVEADIQSGLTPQEISNKYSVCPAGATTELGTVTSDLAARQATTPTGSVFWEAIDSCGYHPQRRELDCSVEVRQRFGFGGTPPGTPGFNGPGSWEWIIFCVDFGTGVLQPINTSAVHVHDEPYGVLPPWYYGVVVQADPTLHATPTVGQTLKARAILSWTLIPTGCNYIPIWGNQADFQIKLDP